MKTIRTFVSLFLASLILSVSTSKAFSQTAPEANPTARQCREGWFLEKNLTPACFKQVGDEYQQDIQAVVIVEFDERHGYKPTAQVERTYQLIGEQVKLVHTSPVTTSREGDWEEVAGDIQPFVQDQDGHWAFPLFQVRKNLTASLHGGLGNLTDHQGSWVCFRVLNRYGDLEALLLGVQRGGGTAWYVLRVTH